jgi:membrane protein YqaA with SNARE-associated domain
MLRHLYDWTMGLAGHRHALPALAGVSFVESSLFPVPPDVLLIPMVLARRERAFTIALVCTLASVVGGFLGYAIGYALFEAVGRPILAFYGAEAQFAQFRAAYAEWGWWIVMGAGFTPFPYKVVTIASGVVGLDPIVFGLASLVSRAARFYLVAALLWRFGPPMRRFIEGNLPLLAAVLFLLLLGGFLAARYLL